MSFFTMQRTKAVDETKRLSEDEILDGESRHLIMLKLMLITNVSDNIISVGLIASDCNGITTHSEVIKLGYCSALFTENVGIWHG